MTISGFNFEQIGSIIGSVTDTDKIDIGRSGLITMPDGSITVTDERVPMYKDIPAHISFSDIDNPDVATVGATPIIHALSINCAVDVDLQNADRIWAYKLAADGTVLEVYEGNIGAPVVNQSRQEATMSVRQGG